MQASSLFSINFEVTSFRHHRQGGRHRQAGLGRPHRWLHCRRRPHRLPLGGEEGQGRRRHARRALLRRGRPQTRRPRH